MKLLITLCCLLLLGGIVNAQDFQGRIVYQQRLIERPQEKSTSPQEEERRAVQTLVFKVQLERDYILDFNRSTSLCKIEAPLSITQLSHPMISAEMINRLGSTKSIYYKNLEENIAVEKKDQFSGLYLITDTLKKYNWKLLPDTKKIGDYICHKAIYVIVDTIEQRQQKADGSFEIIKIPRPEETVAWYTPAIPISNGPGEYGGLPGLILEVNQNNNIHIVATEITLYKNNTMKLVPPTGGKKVTRDGYLKAMRHKL